MFGFQQPFPPIPEDIWLRWNWEPLLLFALGLITWAYVYGVETLWQRAGHGRVIRQWQVAAFLLGVMALFSAFISPLAALSSALFSAHMVQHLLLILVAAPLLVLGAPLLPLLWALPQPTRRNLVRYRRQVGYIQTLWSGLSQPLLVWCLYFIVLWVWHIPTLYQQALNQFWLHELEHITFIGTALLWWWLVLQPAGHRRLQSGVNVLFVFTTALHSGILGALITFAHVPLYPIYASTAAAWGMTLLQDQQLAGVLMWVPVGIIYSITALSLFLSWLNALEQKMQKKEKTLEAKLAANKGT